MYIRLYRFTTLIYLNHIWFSMGCKSTQACSKEPKWLMLKQANKKWGRQTDDKEVMSMCKSPWKSDKKPVLPVHNVKDQKSGIISLLIILLHNTWAYDWEHQSQCLQIYHHLSPCNRNPLTLVRPLSALRHALPENTREIFLSEWASEL